MVCPHYMIAIIIISWASLVVQQQRVRLQCSTWLAMQEIWVQSLDQEDPLEKDTTERLNHHHHHCHAHCLSGGR